MANTVLVVDTLLVTRRMLRFAMELQGYRLIDAVDGTGAFALLAREDVDLLVVGLNAPDDLNRNLVGEVRLHPRFAELPILIIGDQGLKGFFELRSIGNCAWLNRPFRMNEIHIVTESLLGAGRLHDSLSAIRTEGKHYA